MIEKAILDYLREHKYEKPDSITICSYLKEYRLDQVYATLNRLEDEGKIIRYNRVMGGWNGNHYYELGQI